MTPEEIAQLRTTATNAQQTAADLSGAEADVETQLKEALRTRIANSSIIPQRAQAEADWLNSGTEARNTYANPESKSFIFNPYERESLISKSKSQAYVPYSTMSDYLALSLGQIPDLVNSGMVGYRTKMNKATSDAQLAYQSYKDAIDQYYKDEELAMQKYKTYGAGSGTLGQQILQGLQLLKGGSQADTAIGPSKPGYVQGSADTSPISAYKDTATGGEDQQRQLIGMLMMSQANSPAEVKAAYEMLNPTEKSPQVKLKQDQATKQQAYDKATRLINDALTVIGEKGNSSGFNLLYPLQKQGIFGNADPQRMKLDAILSELAGPLAFGEAGKALTATELGLISGKIPTVGLSENTLTTMLNQVLTNINNQRNEYLFSQVGL